MLFVIYWQKPSSTGASPIQDSSSLAGSGFDEKGQSHDGCWEFIPPVTITRGYYRCDRRFHTDTLEELYTNDKKDYGYVLIEGENVLIYKSNTINHHLLYSLSVKRQNHHNKGGQSAPRFQRKFQGEELAYIKKVATLIGKHFLKNNLPIVSGLIIAGPGDMKNKVLDSSEFSPVLKKIVLAVMTTNEVSGDAFLQVVTDSIARLGDADFVKEKELFSSFQELLRLDPDRILFANEVPKALEEGLVESIYVSTLCQEELQLEEINGCNLQIFKSFLLDDFGGLVAIKWY